MTHYSSAMSIFTITNPHWEIYIWRLRKKISDLNAFLLRQLQSRCLQWRPHKPNDDCCYLRVLYYNYQHLLQAWLNQLTPSLIPFQVKPRNMFTILNTCKWSEDGSTPRSAWMVIFELLCLMAFYDDREKEYYRRHHTHHTPQLSIEYKIRKTNLYRSPPHPPFPLCSMLYICISFYVFVLFEK